MARWLFKTEPDEFSIDDLAARGKAGECWDGVRNYQARNMLRDQLAIGDTVFVYHSSCKQVGIAGLAAVCRDAYPDPSQFDTASRYHDPRSSESEPRWYAVDIHFVQAFDRIIPLAALKANPALADMPLVRKGNRLSVMPVSEPEYQAIMSMVA